jgi:hypothetical protein
MKIRKPRLLVDPEAEILSEVNELGHMAIAMFRRCQALTGKLIGFPSYGEEPDRPPARRAKRPPAKSRRARPRRSPAS